MDKGFFSGRYFAEEKNERHVSFWYKTFGFDNPFLCLDGRNVYFFEKSIHQTMRENFIVCWHHLGNDKNLLLYPSKRGEVGRRIAEKRFAFPPLLDTNFVHHGSKLNDERKIEKIFVQLYDTQLFNRRDCGNSDCDGHFAQFGVDCVPVFYLPCSHFRFRFAVVDGQGNEMARARYAQLL